MHNWRVALSLRYASTESNASLGILVIGHLPARLALLGMGLATLGLLLAILRPKPRRARRLKVKAAGTKAVESRCSFR